MKFHKTLITTILLAALTLCLGGCGNRQLRERFDTVERVVTDRPDSALALLREIPDPSRLGTADRARYDLLMAEARYMADSIDTVPTRLLEVAAYFDSENDTHNAARAYYYAGIQTRQKGDYWKAIVSFLKAEKSAKSDKSTDKILRLGLIYRAIADTYNNIMDYASALHYHELSYRLLSSIPDTGYTLGALLDVARDLYGTGQYNASIDTASHVFSMAVDAGSRGTQYTALSLIGDCKYIRKDYQGCSVFYERLLADYPEYAEPEDFRVLGLAYLKNGDLSGAKRMDSIVRGMDETDITLHAFIDRLDGDPKAAFDSLYVIAEKEQKMVLRLWKRDNAKIISDYYGAEEIKASQIINEKENTNRLLLVTIVFFVILMGLLLYFGYKRNRDIRRQHLLYIDDLMDELSEKDARIHRLGTERDAVCSERDELMNINISKDNQLEKMREDIGMMMASRLNVLEVAYLGFNCDNNKEKAVYNSLDHFITEFCNDENILRLENTVNAYTDSIMTRFHSAFPDMPRNESLLFLFYVMRLSPQVISLMFRIRVEALYNRKSKLKKKILASGVDDSDTYLKYL